MLEYTRAELAERELEDRIRRHPHLIEPGLQYLEHQRQTSSGRLDVLFVDSNQTLVVAELKVIEDSYMLIQALDYFDFVADKIEGFARLHANHQIEVERYPRLMLIAPSFTPVMINRCRWLNPDIQVSLFVYQYIKFQPQEEDTLVFIPQEIAVRPIILKQTADLSKLLDYIEDETSRTLAKCFLDEVKKLSSEITIDPIQWGKSVKFRGSVLCHWEPRQAFIRISTLNDHGEWNATKISTDEKYKEIVDQVKRNIEWYKKG
ncbi:MAG: DUF91 domain-containing protein [Phycisphaerae bacterium]|nr:DUF91 domain-containing protein [Phycisphaerae bacterium]